MRGSRGTGTYLLNHLSFSGLEVEWLTDTTAKLYSGRCLDSDNASEIELETDQTLDFGTVGLNGLDTGSIAANTWYYAFVICNPAGDTYGLLSLSATSPTLPEGYTKFRRVASLRVDGDSKIIPVVYSGRGETKNARFLDGSKINLLTGGTAVDYTDIDCSSLIPPVSNTARVYITADTTVYTRRKGDTFAYGRKFIFKDSAVYPDYQPVDSSQVFEYKIEGSGTVDIDACGYVENL